MRTAWQLACGLLAAGCGDDRLGIGPPLERADTLFVAAHPDDDLIFMQPEVLAALGAGSVTTMYVATGDERRGFDHTQHLFEGSKYAYADAAGAAGWECGLVAVGSAHVQHCRALDRALSLIKVDLPDGGIPGDVPTSLRGLVEGKVDELPLLGPNGGSATLPDVVELLAGVVERTAPASIHAQELAGSHGYDHSSHMFVAAFTLWAAARVDFAGELIWHHGYNVVDREPTLELADYDDAARMLGYFEACWGRCGPCGTSCTTLDDTHDRMLQRQYAVARIGAATGRLRSDGRCVGEALVLGDCATAPVFQLEPTGRLRLGGSCLFATSLGGTALINCADEAEQFWALDSEGALWSGRPPDPLPDMSYDHVRCLDGTSGILTTATCGSLHQPRWQFVAP